LPSRHRLRFIGQARGEFASARSHALCFEHLTRIAMRGDFT
jgi:hypothetical protein